MVMQRWDPFRELRAMDDTMNRLWRGMNTLPGASEDWNIALDVIQKEDDIIVKATAPGVKPEDIDVTIEDNILTIRAERKAETEDDKAVYLIRERPVGAFYRALRLPETVDANKVQSSYEHGVLTITLPKAEEKKKKQIKIEVGSGARVLETKKEK